MWFVRIAFVLSCFTEVCPFELGLLWRILVHVSTFWHLKCRPIWQRVACFAWRQRCFTIAHGQTCWMARSMCLGIERLTSGQQVKRTSGPQLFPLWHFICRGWWYICFTNVFLISIKWSFRVSLHGVCWFKTADLALVIRAAQVQKCLREDFFQELPGQLFLEGFQVIS